MQIPVYQRTLKRTASCTGVGLHSGKPVTLTLRPAPANQGITFVRTDLPNKPAITAHFNRVVDTSLATVIGSDGFIVSTIEHLMATFAGLSIDNAFVDLDDYEVPVMDGSAAPYTELMLRAGIREQSAARHYFVITEPIELRENGKFVGIYPDSRFRISCSISFDNPAIGDQQYCLDLSDEAFALEISPARTFGFLHEVEYMKSYGLAQGGSLENAVVVDEDGVINEGGLRFKDEFVRHKLLDSLGDFSLLGLPVLGHLKVIKSGHAFNHAFLEKFFQSKQSWETRTIKDPFRFTQHEPKALAI